VDNKFSNFVKNAWPHMIGGGLTVSISMALMSSLDIGAGVRIVINVLSFIGGILVAETLVFVLRYRRAYSIARSDSDLLAKAKKKGRAIYLLERKIITQYHQDMTVKFEDLVTTGIRNMSLLEYEQLLRFSLEVMREEEIDKIRVHGTCLILPNTFDRKGDYAELWRRFSDETSGLDCELIRILCNHDKEILSTAVKENPRQFEDFCNWNYTTGFDLYLYGGNYDAIRQEMNLPLNDFGILNDLAVVGADMQKFQKIRAVRAAEMIISNTGITYGISRYEELFSRLQRDSRCMRVNLNSSNRYQEVVDFLNEL